MSGPKPLFSLRSRGELTAISYFKHSGSNRLKIVTGHNTGELVLWNLETNRTEIVQQTHGNEKITWIGTTEDKIYSYGRDFNLCIWIAVSGRFENIGSLKVNCHTFCPCDVIKQPCLATIMLAVPHDDFMVQICDSTDFSKLATITPELDSAKCGMVMYLKLVELKSDVMLFIAYESGTLFVFKVERGRQNYISHLDVYKDPITCLDFHPETMRGICGSVNNSLAIWNINADSFEMSIKRCIQMVNPGVECIKIHPLGLYVAVGGWDSRIRIFSWKSLELLAALDFHSGTLNCLTFTPKTEPIIHLAAGSKDGRVSVWNLYNSKAN